MYDLLLKGAHVVDPLNGVNGVNDVAVEGGKVAAVGPDLTGPAREVIDVSGWVLQPGIIDSHVHLGSMWGSPYGPRMLAMNGVTTCLDMAGPLDDILEKTPQYGAGLNTAILQFASPPFTFKPNAPSKAEMVERVQMALKHTSLDGMEKVYPGNLSGGQQQRIALARAIVTNPKVMLLDEPLSNLDPKLRETMRFEIKELQKKFNFTIIFVTHDQSEAMALSDRMMVMDMGNIVQIGTPTELYNRPVNRFVHKFLGQSTFTDVILQDGKAYARGDMEQPLPVALPENGEREKGSSTQRSQYGTWGWGSGVSLAQHRCTS